MILSIEIDMKKNDTTDYLSIFHKLTSSHPKDKVICLMTSWEKTTRSSTFFDKDYSVFSANEDTIFPLIEGLLMDEGFLSFFIYVTEEESSKINPIVEVIPNTDLMMNSIKNKRISISGTVEVVCIDYKYFSKTMMGKFLAIFFTETRYSKDMHAFFQSPPGELMTNDLFETSLILTDVNEYGYTEQICSKIQGNAKFKRGFLPTPFFWSQIRKKGYLSSNEKLEQPDIKSLGDNSDFLFFYSAKALLNYELGQILLWTKRCEKCTHIISAKHAQKRSCKKGDFNFEKCTKLVSRLSTAKSRKKVK